MTRKMISLLLALCILFGCCVPAFAEEDVAIVSDATETEAWGGSLGEYTAEDANAYNLSCNECKLYCHYGRQR